MNFVFLAIIAVLGLLAWELLYYVLRIGSYCKGNKGIGVPEPSGAWPFLGHLPLLGGKDPIARTLATLADKCGPIFSLRLGNRRAVIVSNWEMVKECFTTNDRVLATRPNIAAGRYMGYDNAIFALAPYGSYWRDVRKMATLELLSSHRVEKLKHVRTSEIGSFIKDLGSLCAKNEAHPIEVTMDKLLKYLTFNIIIKMLAGKRFSASEYEEFNTEASRLEHAIEKAAYLFGVFVMADAIPQLEWLDINGHVSSMKKTAEIIDSILKNWLEENLHKRIDRVNTRGEEDDFLDAMISALPEDTIMSGHKRDTIMKATTMVLMLTGSESTSVTLTWALSLLLNNRHALMAAQEELDIHVGRDRKVQESDIKNLKYLQAIVKETFRLYPPSPLTGVREAMENCYVGGHLIPKGSWLFVNIWKLHRDSRVWSNPDQFQPERFLKSQAEIDFKGQHFEYIPFSSGRRSCPGLTLGLQVVHLTLASLLQGFNITTPGEMPVDMRESLGLALPKLNPLNVIITPRLSPNLYEYP